MADISIPSTNPANNLTIERVEGEARILDTDLAARLGFAEPRMIRNLIKRHLTSLDALGVRSTVKQTPDNNGLGGAPATAYYLNRKQAIFITAKSETVNATEITIDIIERFDAYERGAATTFDPMVALNDPKTLRQLLAGYSERVETLEAKVEVMSPKADGFDRIANAEGSMSITEAAKALQLPKIKALFEWMHANKWTYRRAGGKNWLAHQDKIRDGLLEHKVTTVSGSSGEDKVVESVRVTPAGLTKLAKVFNQALISQPKKGNGTAATLSQEGRA